MTSTQPQRVIDRLTVARLNVRNLLPGPAGNALAGLLQPKLDEHGVPADVEPLLTVADALQQPRDVPDRPDITDAQAVVLALMAEGMTAAQIARKLQISRGTVYARRGEAYRLLGANDAPHAIALAIRHGLIAGRAA
ncbi:helix-turn-helix transcriptional regulator [Saccharothrix stipae]